MCTTSYERLDCGWPSFNYSLSMKSTRSYVSASLSYKAKKTSYMQWRIGVKDVTIERVADVDDGRATKMWRMLIIILRLTW